MTNEYRKCRKCKRDIVISRDRHVLLNRKLYDYYYCDDVCFGQYMDRSKTWLRGLYKDGIVERVIP